MNGTEKSSLNYWYPKVHDLKIPMPKTEIPVTKDFWEWITILDGEDILSEGEKQAIRTAANLVGSFPVFMRSDLCSGKHSFRRTCFVEDKRALISCLERTVHGI